MESREQLRLRFRESRKKLSPQQRDELSIKIANRSLELPIWNYALYHLFLTIDRQLEINTEFLLQVLHGKDKNIVVSRSDFAARTMTHFLLTDQTTLQISKYGIPEPSGGIQIRPEQIDVVFVPLLAADLKGNRLGYGKGFYDRFLAGCRAETIKVGLSFFAPVKQIMDVHVHDIALDFLVTPDEIFTYG